MGQVEEGPEILLRIVGAEVVVARRALVDLPGDVRLDDRKPEPVRLGERGLPRSPWGPPVVHGPAQQGDLAITDPKGAVLDPHARRARRGAARSGTGRRPPDAHRATSIVGNRAGSSISGGAESPTEGVGEPLAVVLVVGVTAAVTLPVPLLEGV